MNVAIIGCGAILYLGHGPALLRYREKHEEVRLYACCDIDWRAGLQAKERFGAEKFYDSLDKLLEDPKVDCVILCLPTRCITEAALKIIRRGIPLLIEKPPGNGVEEALLIQKELEEHQVYHEVALNRRSMPLVNQFKDMLYGKKLRYLRLDMYRCRRQEPNFHETAIHGVDLLRYLSGSDYLSLEAVYDKIPGSAAANIYIRFTMKNGIHGDMAFCPMGGAVLERVTADAADTTGFLHLPVWGGYDTPGHAAVVCREKVRQTAGEEVDQCVSNGFYAQLEHFLQGAAGGGVPKNPVSSCIQALRVCAWLGARGTKIDF